MGHVVGHLISWFLVGIGGVIPGWALEEWGREVLFGPRNRERGSDGKS